MFTAYVDGTHTIVLGRSTIVRSRNMIPRPRNVLCRKAPKLMIHAYEACTDALRQRSHESFNNAILLGGVRYWVPHLYSKLIQHLFPRGTVKDSFVISSNRFHYFFPQARVLTSDLFYQRARVLCHFGFH